MPHRWMMIALLLLPLSGLSSAAPVLMISVDGLKPEHVLEAEARGVKVPYLSSLTTAGCYASGVIGVWPTITYPSHTTLVTGVTPAEHGIVSNLEFDPLHRFQDAWYWYASRIRTPTLWQRAHDAGLSTASIGWPVTVGATGIDYLIPEYWRITGTPDHLNPSDRELLAALARPTGLLSELQQSTGPYMQGNDTSRQGDEIKTAYALEVLRRYRPHFMTLHLSSLDEAQHAHGVYSREANETLESIDRMLARLARTALANDAATVIAVVSDHGFAPVTRDINLYVPFVEAGLITVADDPPGHLPTIRSWRAQPWFAGGMAAVMLQDPRDETTEKIVAALLGKLRTDPDNGIADVLDRRQAAARGAFPDAAFLVLFKPGFYAGLKWSGRLIGDIAGSHGGHGFSPDNADMHASLFMAGRGVARHRNLGIVDLRQIAPTVARVLDIELPGASGRPLPVAE